MLFRITISKYGEILRMRESSPPAIARCCSTILCAVPMKTALLLLLLSLLWSLVEVHSQTAAPYVSFMGENLPNHAYVDLTLVGDDADNSMRCNTDLTTCCTSSHTGDWYFPNETTLQLIDNGDNIYQRFGNSLRVLLRRRNNAMEPSGIYRCDIATVAVHDDSDPSVRETVYVGLYASGGICAS